MSKFNIFKDARGEFRWRFQADNNKIVASSGEGYKNKADCKHAIEIIKKDGPKAEVVDGTEE
jgi:uncharacterized protein YegP (UPF0339 family)